MLGIPGYRCYWGPIIRPDSHQLGTLFSRWLMGVLLDYRRTSASKCNSLMHRIPVLPNQTTKTTTPGSRDSGGHPDCSSGTHYGEAALYRHSQGDAVHVFSTRKRRNWKLKSPWAGSFKVMKRQRTTGYVPQPLNGGRRRHVHYNRLKPCYCRHEITSAPQHQAEEPRPTSSVHNPKSGYSYSTRGSSP